jgi:hypothetical protein
MLPQQLSLITSPHKCILQGTNASNSALISRLRYLGSVEVAGTKREGKWKAPGVRYWRRNGRGNGMFEENGDYVARRQRCATRRIMEMQHTTHASCRSVAAWPAQEILRVLGVEEMRGGVPKRRERLSKTTAVGAPRLRLYLRKMV